MMSKNISNDKSKAGSTPQTVNLLDVAATESMEQTLDLVRLGNDEIAIIPFTAEGQEVDIHYCRETEINSYIVCNGPDCVLCRIGRKRDQRMLLPVYVPTAACVGILPVSRSLRPYALLPQISNVLKSKTPKVMFVVREGAQYHVSTTELQKDVDSGEGVIKCFLEDHKSDSHDFSSVYPTIDNEQLANVEEITRMLKLKGVNWNASDKRS